MSIVQDQLEDLLRQEGIDFNSISELRGDNFSIECDNPERTCERMQNIDLDATYDDEEGDVIVHFEGLDDSKSIRSLHSYVLRNRRQIKANMLKKARHNLRLKGLL